MTEKSGSLWWFLVPPPDSDGIPNWGSLRPERVFGNYRRLQRDPYREFPPSCNMINLVCNAVQLNRKMFKWFIPHTQSALFIRFMSMLFRHKYLYIFWRTVFAAILHNIKAMLWLGCVFFFLNFYFTSQLHRDLPVSWPHLIWIS